MSVFVSDESNNFNDEYFMRRAIELAKGGTGRTNPNPLVGAVIVKDGCIIGEGFHHKYGDLHAERDALRDCAEKNNDPAGAAIYVTLEPCCHYGKQPPCTLAVAEAGIKKVVIGSRDPNPLVSGKGTEFLRSKGIEVKEDFLRNECDALNPIFFHYITTKMPYVALKFAMTLDGKIATSTGDSKWISCEKSREHAHSLRNKYACILAGIGTVLADDPMLTCRIEGGRNPVRIICDSRLRIPLESRILQSAKEVETIIAYAAQEDTASGTSVDFNGKMEAIKACGAEVICAGKGHVDLKQLMTVLGERKLDSVLIEGGGEINYSALETGIVSHIYAYVAPELLGGSGKTPVSGKGMEKVADAFRFRLEKVERIENDILLEYGK